MKKLIFSMFFILFYSLLSSSLSDAYFYGYIENKEISNKIYENIKFIKDNYNIDIVFDVWGGGIWRLSHH